MGLFQTQKRTAVFSPDRKYRYRLTTIWDEAKPLLVGLFCNPSIADERREDNTDRLFRARAKELGYGGTAMINMFAYVTTYPSALWEQKDPVGPDNDHHIIEVCNANRDVFCGWGLHGSKNYRADIVLKLIRKHNEDRNRFYYLRLLKNGQPSHPLYIRKTTPLTLWDV